MTNNQLAIKIAFGGKDCGNAMDNGHCGRDKNFSVSFNFGKFSSVHRFHVKIYTILLFD